MENRDLFQLLSRVVGIQARLIKELYSMKKSTHSFGSPVDHYYSKYAREFTVEKVLGSGAFGEVTLCKHIIDGQLCAIKRIDVKNRDDDEKFAREFQLLSTMDHPNIIRYHTAWYEDHFRNHLNSRSSPGLTLTRRGSSLGEINSTNNMRETNYGKDWTFRSSEILENNNSTRILREINLGKDWTSRSDENVDDDDNDDESDNVPRRIHSIYIRMEFCEMDLSEWMNLEGVLEIIKKHEHIFTAVLQGLKYIHGMSIFHRDIKPRNILINLHPFQVKLADFGLARETKSLGSKTSSALVTFCNLNTADSNASIDITSDIGSLLYAAPEQRTGGKGYGPKSDIYSTGVVMFELVCCKEWSTYHERVVAIHDFIEGRVFPNLTKTVNDSELLESLVILHYSRGLISEMVHLLSANRPSADEAVRKLQEFKQEAMTLSSNPSMRSSISYSHRPAVSIRKMAGSR